jgi:hypothetical protein
VAWAIKVGSLLRRYRAPYRRFCHTALVIGADGMLAEALARGVVRSPLAKYDDADYILVRTGVSEHDQEQIRAYARSVLHAKARYGFATYVGLAIYCVTAAQVCAPGAGTAVCSGFVAEALTRAGYVWARPPFAMLPADLAEDFAVDVRDRLAVRE